MTNPQPEEAREVFPMRFAMRDFGPRWAGEGVVKTTDFRPQVVKADAPDAPANTVVNSATLKGSPDPKAQDSSVADSASPSPIENSGSGNSTSPTTTSNPTPQTPSLADGEQPAQPPVVKDPKQTASGLMALNS